MEQETDVTAQYDLAVDFMDMTDARRLWTRRSDARPGFEAVVGGYAIVGDDDDDDARVARIIDIDPDGNIELEVLDGTVEAHLDLVTPA
jgi:hypothetical protein